MTRLARRPGPTPDAMQVIANGEAIGALRVIETAIRTDAQLVLIAGAA